MDGSPTDHHVSLSHKRPRESSQAPPQRNQVLSGIHSFITARLLCFSHV